MHVDIEGATRIARLAAEFDWTWAVDDLEPFCAQAGWELVEFGQTGGSIRTDLRVGRPNRTCSGGNTEWIGSRSSSRTWQMMLRP